MRITWKWRNTATYRHPEVKSLQRIAPFDLRSLNPPRQLPESLQRASSWRDHVSKSGFPYWLSSCLCHFHSLNNPDDRWYSSRIPAFFEHKFWTSPQVLFASITSFTMAWKCPLCLLFICLSLDSLLTHFNSWHCDDTVLINCRFDGCDKHFTKVNSLVKHVRNRHRPHLFDSEQSCDASGISIGKLRFELKHKSSRSHSKRISEWKSPVF